jgi:hypothetical protein
MAVETSTGESCKYCPVFHFAMGWIPPPLFISQWAGFLRPCNRLDSSAFFHFAVDFSTDVCFIFKLRIPLFHCHRFHIPMSFFNCDFSIDLRFFAIDSIVHRHFSIAIFAKEGPELLWLGVGMEYTCQFHC